MNKDSFFILIEEDDKKSFLEKLNNIPKDIILEIKYHILHVQENVNRYTALVLIKEDEGWRNLQRNNFQIGKTMKKLE